MNTKNYKPLSELGYSDDYIITKLGLIIATANLSLLEPNKNLLYRLTTKDGKKVYRALKPLYRQAFGVEYAVDNIESLDGELWKAIDSKGKYFISNQGRVKSYQGRNAKILTPYPNLKGYLRVDILSDCRRTYLVHLLVGLAFIPNDNPIERNTIDHIDLDKKNNCVTNLRWMSRAENTQAYIQHKKGVCESDDIAKPKDSSGE